MVNQKDDCYYLGKIITDLEFICKHTADLSYDDLVLNEILVDSVLFRLIQISENSDRLTEVFKQNHSTIRWRAMKGMRNRIVHEYGNVDFGVVYVTVKNDVPNLLKELESIVD